MILSLRLVFAVRAVQAATLVGGLRGGRPTAAVAAVLVPPMEPHVLHARIERAAAVGRRPPACLPRALIVAAALRRAGVDADLKIGVRHAADRLEAHAWVEVAGAALGGAEDAGFAALPPLR